MTEVEVLREQGALRARQDAVDKDIIEIKKDVKEILEFVNQTKGGNKMLFGLLTAASTLGAIFGSAITYWKGH